MGIDIFFSIRGWERGVNREIATYCYKQCVSSVQKCPERDLSRKTITLNMLKYIKRLKAFLNFELTHFSVSF